MTPLETLHKIKKAIGEMPAYPRGDIKLNAVLADMAKVHAVVDTIEILTNQAIKQMEATSNEKKTSL